MAYAVAAALLLASLPWYEPNALAVAAAVAGLATALATHNRALPTLSFAVDLLVAVAVAIAGMPFLALIIVVGWTGLIGIVSARGHWGHALAGGLAATAVVGIDHVATDRTSLAPGVAVVGVLALLFGVAANRIAAMATAREMELEALFQRIPAAMYRTGADGSLIEGNTALAELLGTGPGPVRLSSEEIDAMHVERRARARLRRELDKAPAVRDFEMTVINRTGRRLVLLNHANVIRRPDGSVEFYEGVVFDITAFRDAQASRERLARIVEDTSDLVLLANPDGTISYANAAARAWLHTHTGEDELTHVTQVVTDTDLEKITSGLALDEEWSGEVALTVDERTLYLRIVAHRFETDGRTYIAIVAQDLTSEREAANRLAELIRSKDQFIAAVSHELRTPLAAVVGMSAELRDRFDELEPGVADEFMWHVAEQSQEVANIVEDLLVAARIDTASIVLVGEVVDIAEAVDLTTQALLGRNPACVLEVTATGQCFADPRRVRQILRNLLTNAVRYGGERVTVTTGALDGAVAIRVADNGSGVPAERVDHIFEPFESAHIAGTQPSSVGLGLTVSRWLARQMGGDLVYDRADGESIFTLSLPAVGGSD